ncbi:MAG: FkbM family methyltransferase [Bacteroidia bacterium]
MKALIQYILQFILGYQNYLWVFTRYKLRRLKKDPSEKDFFHFLNMLNVDDTVLDIGANLGLMSFFLAKKVKKVHAFEPIPSNIEVLRKLKASKKLDNLEIHNTALGNSTGEIDLILPVVRGVRKQGLSHVKHEKMTEFNQGETHKSSIYKLDDYHEISNERIAGIKIDVENFEYEVFQGARQRILADKPLIYSELWDNQNRYDCFDLMKNLGYNIFVLHQDKLQLFEDVKSQTQNFFFIHQDYTFAQ